VEQDTRLLEEVNTSKIFIIPNLESTFDGIKGTTANNETPEET
jgi:hypothetical protein